MLEHTPVLVAAATGGTTPLWLLIYQLSKIENKEARQLTTRNAFTWIWHVLILPGAAAGYAFTHESLGQLDLAAAFELGIGIPIVLQRVFDRFEMPGTHQAAGA
jgi:hypothetical protein